MKKEITQIDVALIGGGIMTTTLAVLMKKLMPEANIQQFEKLDKVASESTDSWNNAGTGHSAFCELNYTPEQEDGTINIDKGLQIAESFDISRQFWAYLRKNHFADKDSFIKAVPHMSFVWGEENIKFLRKRHETMTKHAFFNEMEYSEDFDKIAEWIPLMMKERERNQKIGVTRMAIGTDVNFDAITKGLVEFLETQNNYKLNLNHKVKNIRKNSDGSWNIKVKDTKSGVTKTMQSKFVFIGAGGGSLPLLQKSGIKEGKGYGGFPVSGLFLRCTNQELVDKHVAKVYGKAAEGSPPMSMPHLDARVIEGKKSLMFGPYAGMSTKFLKNGSYCDLPKSMKFHNIWPILSVGVREFGLVKYLIGQVFLSPKGKFKTLKAYYPEAKMEDWELIVAGMRVQIMKKDKKKGGILKLGTEIINNQEGSLVALLGASPGASTAVSIMLEVLEKCYPEQMATQEWKAKLSEMIPSFGKSLRDDADLIRKVRKESAASLDLLG